MIPVENYESLTVKSKPDVVLGNVVRLSREAKAKCNLVGETGERNCDACEVAQAQVEKCDDDVMKLRCECLTTMLGLNGRVHGLSTDQLEKMKGVVEENHDVFALDDNELGCTDIVQHVINTGDHPPIKQPVRRLPFVH